MQPQGHLQLLTNILDFNMTAQAAVDAPRFRVRGDFAAVEGELGKNDVVVERDIPDKMVDGLRDRGFDVAARQVADTVFFGRAQVLIRDTKGVIDGGSDPRADGQVGIL